MVRCRGTPGETHCSRYNRLWNQVLLTKRSGNQVLQRIQKGLAQKFCVRNFLATKFCVQNGLAPKPSLQNGLATGLYSQHRLAAKFCWQMVWQPSSAYKTMRCLCTPFLYDKRGNWPPQCLQNGCEIDSTVSTVLFPTTTSLLQKDAEITKGFRKQTLWQPSSADTTV